MRLWCTGIICLAAFLLAGCEEEQKAARVDQKKLDIELVNTLNNIQVENAIITQHTLYPYHFVTDGAGLNDLGERDSRRVGVRASAYRQSDALRHRIAPRLRKAPD